MQAWYGLVKNGKLPTRLVWTSYTHQLWPGLRYGLGASPATMIDLSKGLRLADYYLLSSLGVVRMIRKEWRYLPPTFSGIGLHDLITEVTAATLSSFLQHYGQPTGLGITLQAALENMQIKIGVPDCPLDYDYKVWGHLTTDSWIKLLWEKLMPSTSTSSSTTR